MPPGSTLGFEMILKCPVWRPIFQYFRLFSGTAAYFFKVQTDLSSPSTVECAPATFPSIAAANTCVYLFRWSSLLSTYLYFTCSWTTLIAGPLMVSPPNGQDSRYQVNIGANRCRSFPRGRSSCLSGASIWALGAEHPGLGLPTVSHTSKFGCGSVWRFMNALGEVQVGGE
jgi:hypothetical protein